VRLELADEIVSVLIKPGHFGNGLQAAFRAAAGEKDEQVEQREEEDVPRGVEVLDSQEALRDDGRWYMRQIRPFRTEIESTTGVAITFADITAIRAMRTDPFETLKDDAQRTTASASAKERCPGMV